MTQTKTTQNGAGMPAAKGSAKKYSAGGYRAIAVIVFVLGVGGLFLGLLSSVVGFIAHGPLYATGEGDVLSGSLIIERIFSVPGIGGLYIQSIQELDYNVFMAVTIFYTFIGLAANIIVDLSYGFLDPRIRMGAKK